jgi:hypothetical protein
MQSSRRRKAATERQATARAPAGRYARTSVAAWRSRTLAVERAFVPADSVILEGIVTTLNSDGALNIAPMGPLIEPELGLARFILRPFKTATTFQNLSARGEGVFHVTDDVLLLAQTAIGIVPQPPPWTRLATIVNGQILLDACRYHEFRVVELDDREDRATIRVETVAEGRLRDFFGFNRAKHAVVEAAILATRTDWLPLGEILDELRKLAVTVDKTGGPRERAAFTLLHRHVHQVASRRGLQPDSIRSPS